MQELKKNVNTITGMICLAVVTLASIASVSNYVIQEKTLMAQNIESAIQRGIDPLSVRCSYAASDDIVCVTYAHNSQQISIPVVSK